MQYSEQNKALETEFILHKIGDDADERRHRKKASAADQITVRKRGAYTRYAEKKK